MVIYWGTDRYQIRLVVIIRRRNRRNRVSNDGLMLGKPNNRQSKVRNNTYTLSRDVGTFNIRYDVVRLVLVYQAESSVGDIGDSNVVSGAGTRAQYWF
jgi:hypothetical protein